MISYVIIVALALTAVHAFPQHGHATSHSSFSLAHGSQHVRQQGYSQIGNYGQASYGHGGHHEVDYYAHPKYHYEYSVKDEHTGDVKSQHEERDGDNTRGYYTVNEPDGTILTVHYTVDKHSGFQAVVERKGHAAHPQQVEKVAVVAPIVHHAPSYHY
ncbi:cuticle protein 7-like [Ischnura elegans]|uniref:cuticle protein 7-like n=1 Tax=Ischnura elegans TaxID=197161 RepID=UPI001ED8904E|nr:cuticle protein 7-like [Ischnura elegans]